MIALFVQLVSSEVFLFKFLDIFSCFFASLFQVHTGVTSLSQIMAQTRAFLPGICGTGGMTAPVHQRQIVTPSLEDPPGRALHYYIRQFLTNYEIS